MPLRHCAFDHRQLDSVKSAPVRTEYFAGSVIDASGMPIDAQWRRLRFTEGVQRSDDGPRVPQVQWGGPRAAP